MRFKDPLIIGGGPAGSTAAIQLAIGGSKPVIWERNAVVGDALCGGFLSWATLAKLGQLGIVPDGHRVDHVRLFAGRVRAQAALPKPAIGISRRSLDTLLLARARAAGAGVETVYVRDATQIDAETVFLATGKHDLRGLARSKPADTDPTLGLRITIAPHPALQRLVGGAIELHLFDRGYAGLLLQEDGRANLCLAVRKSRLTEVDGDPRRLLIALGEVNPVLRDRLAFLDTMPKADAIAAVPYGWRAQSTTTGVFRLGDQAAVIPSLAGEGMGIAVASGSMAAAHWLKGGADAADPYQRAFARRTRRPVALAKAIWMQGEAVGRARIGVRTAAYLPWLANAVARLTRVGD